MGLAMVLLVSWGCGALAGASIVGLTWPIARRVLATFAPEGRARALGLLLLTPALTGISLVAMAFGPCLQTLASGRPDACDHHGGPHVYLCLFRQVAPSAIAWIAGTLSFAWLLKSLVTFVGGLRRTRRLAHTLRATAQVALDDNDSCRVVPGRVSLTAGCPRAEVFLGEDLLDALGSDRAAVLIAHERSHQRNHHVLFKITSRALAGLHLPVVASRMVFEFETAIEEACDAEAAAVVGDRLLVAESLIHAARLSASPVPVAGASFTDGEDALTRRVAALCAPAPTTVQRSHWWIVAGLSAVIGALLTFDHRVHDVAENVLQLLGA